MEKRRCSWAASEIEIVYHDHEWGHPLHDDQRLFEMLILEGMQAGLSWITILKKRENMRAAFDGFDPVRIAEYDDTKRLDLLSNPGIIRNRAKINALIVNARLFLDIQKEYGSFDRYIWSFVDYKQVVNSLTDQSQIPATSSLSDKMSKELKKIGFKFVGSTICYAFMQATGMVNDHMIWCEQYEKCQS